MTWAPTHVTWEGGLAQVLILLPLRSAALRWVTRLCQLAQRETRADSVQHKQRFLEEFGADDEGEPEEEERRAAAQEGAAEGGSKGAKRALGGGKPADHEALFAGNSDDHFRLGIKLTQWVAAGQEPLIGGA